MLFPVNQGVVGPDGPGAIDVIDQRECAELFGERLDGNVDDAVLLETRHGQRPTVHDNRSIAETDSGAGFQDWDQVFGGRE